MMTFFAILVGGGILAVGIVILVARFFSTEIGGAIAVVCTIVYDAIVWIIKSVYKILRWILRWILDISMQKARGKRNRNKIKSDRY